MTGPRLRLDLAYDGAAFHGWAAQDGLRTVQGTLEHWITTVLRLPEPARLTVAGRTDAGVHARGQVAHLDLPPDADAPATAAALAHRLARVLPDDVVAHAVTVAPPGFDARFAAIWRRYVFRLADRAVDPLHRGIVVRVRGALDEVAMADAASRLLGLHDFAAFCKHREGATTVRTLLDAEVRRVGQGELAGVVAVELRADAFCHSMVRSLVGALVDVGRGRRAVGWPASLLDRPGRAGEVAVLAPHGLVLEEVGYPDDARLAARVAEARARRAPITPDRPDSEEPE